MKKYLAIILVILTTLFTSTAQILYKIGSKNIDKNINSIIYNWPIMLGLILYGIGFVMIIRSLKDEEVTKLYPIMTLSYVWVTISSYYFFGESINLLKIIGVITIIIGIIVINKSEKTIKLMSV